ncbi:PLP-dependent transferase [Streptomyces cavernicola]|uniref:PLP-dependent transferase n=1 Tax=Streptomyces cavernicola TaxID=3043613 RepID=A0ABT6SLG2_9ACTN|nr:PLP-dependent transferase [Streptomyces sp. B-S-A6]MDI3409032.1 PLP-dependent transferase [Streptomyces sp. B-S-A6]
MDASDLAEWRWELRTRLGRLSRLVRRHADPAAIAWVQGQIAAVGAAAATASEPWSIAEVDDAEATVTGQCLNLVYGGARIAPPVGGTALRHPEQRHYHPGDGVYTPCGTVEPDYGERPVQTGHFAFDGALEALVEQPAAVLGSGGATAFAMSSGMAALRVPILLLLERLRAAGQKLVASADAWVETLSLLRQCGSDVCRIVTAETAEELAAHADAPDVGAVLFEPVSNTPAQRVIDPQRFWSALNREVAVIVDVSQNPLQDVLTGPLPRHVFIACSMTKWAAGGSQRQAGGVLLARTDRRTVDDLLEARAVQRAVPARLEDAAWMDVDSAGSLRSRLVRYQRNQSILARALRSAAVEVRYRPGAAYVLLGDHARTSGWAARKVPEVVREAGERGLRIGYQGTFGISVPAVSLVRSGTEYGLRLSAGSGPRSVATRLASAASSALAPGR